MLLERVHSGDASASGRLMELVYEELRRLAASYARNQRAGHTLQPTALVHEAFVKLVDAAGSRFHDRAHFFAVAATAMRQILTDHVRRQRAVKRGGEAWNRVTLDGLHASASENEIDLEALESALTKLSAFDPRKYRVVELRFFGGLSVEDVSRVMDVSKTTVESEWRAARAWLAAQLAKP